MKQFSLRYALLTYRLDQIWFPLAFWALFAIICLFMRQTPQLMNAVRAYLGAGIPLIAGIMAAYAVLDDPVLELRFATSVSPLRTLIERLGMTFLIQAAFAFSFQLFSWSIGAEYSMYLSVWHLQLAWILPTLALMSLGCLISLLGAQSTMGAMAVGLVWIVELIARDWMAQNNSRFVLVFMGALMPDHPDLLANALVLVFCSLVFVYLSWILLRRQERYI